MAHSEFDNKAPFHRPWTVDYQLAAATAGPVELKAVRSANHRLYIKHIVVSVTTYAAQNMTFRDDAGTPVPIAFFNIPGTGPTAGGSQEYNVDFLSSGTPLTTGTNFDLILSGAGVAARIHVEGYEVIENPMAVGSNN